MSIFVPSNCQIVGDTAVSHLAWSRHDQIVALSAYSIDENDKETNQVLFANSEGEMVQASEITHDFEASVLEWHPTDRVVAIGWADGMVSTWAADGKTRSVAIYSNNNQHHTAISLIRWSSNGKRLITGDKKGTVCVWAADNRGSLTALRQYKKKGEITCLAFCNAFTRDASAKRKTDAKVAAPTSFFYGTDKGTIVHADDLGHCADVHQLSSPIDHLLFFEEKSRLIVMTRSLLLTQYQVSDDGKVSRVMQIKLSVSGDASDKGIKSLLWAGPGLLVSAAEEKIIRFFDLASDDTYNISLTSALGGFIDRSDRISQLAFNPVDRNLATGTQMGIVAIWKFNGMIRDLDASKGPVPSTSAGDWELMFRLSLGAPILQLNWWFGRGALAAVTEDETVFLNESVMNGLVCGDLAVIQENATEVTVYTGDASESAKVNTGIQIRGLAVGRSCFVCWSGKVAKVYRVDPNTHRIEALDPIKCTSVSMAIADASYIVDEAWFVVEPSTVRINNFMGTQKGMINFSEAEGAPQHLDVNGRYIAVMTNKGCVKIVNVHTPTKPKLQVTGNIFTGKVTPSTGNSGSSINNVGINFDSSLIKVRAIKVNASGTVVAVLCDIIEPTQRINYPDTKLYIYDAVRGSLSSFDFSTLKRYPVNVLWDESDDRLFACEAYRIRDVLPAESSSSNGNGSANSANGGTTSNKSGNTKLSATSGEEKSPVEDKNGDNSNNNTSNKDQVANTEVYLMFATSEQGILMQDSLSSDDGFGPLIGFNVPRIYYRKATTKSHERRNDNDDIPLKNNANSTANGNILVKVMRDFMGMNNVNDVIKSALLDFSFFLTLGKLDDAYRVVKEINSPVIWENMAQMCVKTKRIDVAEVCLGNMGNARGAAAVREAKKEGNLEVTIGVLAIQLGLLDDAAALFREAGRYDMLNKLYQASGFWEKAILTAEEHDRIHLKTTHYKFAKYLESVGHVDDAIEHFERSQNARSEVPRMLFHLGRIDDLGEYVLRSDDGSLAKWWASYLESIDRLDKAKKYYSKAKDYLSLVRIYCFKGDFQKAAEIVTETGDRASAYHFARQLENQGEFQEAITFYAMSGCYNHSIRLARAHNLDSELMRFALKSTQALMIECAQHFEMKEEYDKAVQLYHKGGDIPRALELCFRIGEENPKHPHAAIAFDMLNSIAQDLGVDSSPQTLARCADFLVQHKQYDKAIELYVMAKRYHAAIEMAMQHRVNLTDEMVEKLTPPENLTNTQPNNNNNGIVDSSERREILKDLAKALKKQGSFTLASKKYTQAGDRVRAIKCLVRSGDTKAVIQFASISRNNEIYTLAANYLQQMNWRESMDIMKAIIMFYTKAKSFMQLAGFYDSCAQVEIDEYRDYDKAIGALNEALKYLSKETSASNTSTGRAAIELQKNIEKRVMLIEKFMEAKAAARNEPQTMIAICEALLQDPSIEEAIRIGDLLGMLIEFFYHQNSMQDAYHYLREMEDRKIQPFPYVEASVVHDIYKAVGVSRGGAAGGTSSKNKNKMNDEDFETKQNDGPRGGNGGGGNNRRGVVDDDEDGVGEELDEEIDEVMEEDSPAKPDPRKNRGGQSYGYRK